MRPLFEVNEFLCVCVAKVKGRRRRPLGARISAQHIPEILASFGQTERPKLGNRLLYI